MAAGGIISMFRALPMIVGSLRGAFGDLASRQRGGKGKASRVPRTERDLPLSVVIFGSLGLVRGAGRLARLGAGLQLSRGCSGALLIVLFGFLFVTVSSRLTGEIGSSSNPISGMTVATLLLTCLGFVLLGHTGKAATLTRADRGGRRLHRGLQRRHDVAGSQDRLSRRRHARGRSRSRF